jgi:hypothetical protein
MGLDAVAAADATGVATGPPPPPGGDDQSDSDDGGPHATPPAPSHAGGTNNPSEPVDQTQRITVTGKALVRDAQGNRYELSRDGYVVIYKPDGSQSRVEAPQAQASGLTTAVIAAHARAIPMEGVGAALTATLVEIGAAALRAVRLGGP